MNSYVLWASPTITVALAIGLLRWSPTRAAILGLLMAVPISYFAGPTSFYFDQLVESTLRGAWIGATIAPYIFGGLLFWRVASTRPVDENSETGIAALSPLARRRRIFFACFLVGPFAESATGFGVGMVGTVAMLRHLGLPARYLMVFALLSQTMIPWGAMSSGTLLGSAYVRVTPTDLALHAFIPMAALMGIWMAVFWAALRRANEFASSKECVREVLWIGAGLGALAACTLYLGPETALLAAYSPLIVLRYLMDERPNRSAIRKRALECLPYGLIIGWLAATRLAPDLRLALTGAIKFAPFPDLPALFPLMHAGLWFLFAGLLTASMRGQASMLGQQVKSAWVTGRQAIWTVLLFAMMAEMLAKSGIAQGLATGLFHALGPDAILLIPSISGALGILTNSGNPGNSLFLPPLAALATQASMNVLAVAAVQHVSGMALGIFSPVRMSIAASLSNGHQEQGSVYKFLIPYAVASFVAMTAFAWLATRA